MVKMTYWFMFCVAAMVIIMVIWAFPGNAHEKATPVSAKAPVASTPQISLPPPLDPSATVRMKGNIGKFLYGFTCIFFIAIACYTVGANAYIAANPTEIAKQGITWSLGLSTEAGLIVALVMHAYVHSPHRKPAFLVNSQKFS